MFGGNEKPIQAGRWIDGLGRRMKGPFGPAGEPDRAENSARKEPQKAGPLRA